MQEGTEKTAKPLTTETAVTTDDKKGLKVRPNETVDFIFSGAGGFHEEGTEEKISPALAAKLIRDGKGKLKNSEDQKRVDAFTNQLPAVKAKNGKGGKKEVTV